MVIEIVRIKVKAGEEAAFEADVKKATALFLRAKGCTGVELRRSIENPSRYYLRVEWATVDNHMVDFRNSEDFKEWRATAGSHFDGPPEMEHIDLIVAKP